MEWLDTVSTMLPLPAPAYSILIAISFAVLVVGLVREMRKGAASRSQEAPPLWRRAIPAMAQLFVLLIGLAGTFMLADWVATAIFAALITIWFVTAALLSRRAGYLAAESSTNGISRFMLEPELKALIRQELESLQATSPAGDSLATSITPKLEASSQDVVDREARSNVSLVDEGSAGDNILGDNILGDNILGDNSAGGDIDVGSSLAVVLPSQMATRSRPLNLPDGRTARLKQRVTLGKQTIRSFRGAKAR